MLVGTETTATALSTVSSLLSANPSVFARLKSEVRSAFSKPSEITANATAQLKYLNACLNESMRVNTAFPINHYRITPSEGARIQGEFVPGGYNVTVHAVAAFGHKSNFARPGDFVPERWLPGDSDRDPVFDNDIAEAFRPFGYGVHNCIGEP